MQQTSSEPEEWGRYIAASVPWAIYDVHRKNEYQHDIEVESFKSSTLSASVIIK